LLDAIEAVEDTVEIFQGDTNTFVGDAQANFCIACIEPDRDGPAHRRVGHCVAQQVIQRLFDTHSITHHWGDHLRYVHYEAMAGRPPPPMFYPLVKKNINTTLGPAH